MYVSNVLNILIVDLRISKNTLVAYISIYTRSHYNILINYFIHIKMYNYEIFTTDILLEQYS